MLQRYSLFLFILFFSCSSSYENLSVDKLYNKASFLYKKGKVKESVKAYKYLILAFPKTKESYKSIYDLANIYNNIGAYKKAIEYLKLYIELSSLKDSKLYDVYIKIGDIYYDSLKDYNLSLDYFLQANEFSYKKANVFNLNLKIAKSYFKLFNFDLAIKFFKEASVTYTENIDKIYLQEVLYYLAYSEIMFLKETKDAYVLSGYGYFDNEDIDRILKNINVCEKIDNASKYGVMCKYLKVDFLIENGRKKDALEVLEDLRDLYPNKKIIDYRIQNLKKSGK